MLDIIPSLLTAFIITFFAIPSIIRIAKEKNLYDEPGERHAHSTNIPTLGGLGIFVGLIFSVTFFIPFTYDEFWIPQHYGAKGETPYIQYLLCAYIIIFLIGAKDDLLPLSPSKKFLGQLFATFILVYKANIQLTSLYGIFGISNIPLPVGIALSIFTIILIINALNLIDGIDALSGTVGCIICITLGYYFYKIGRPDLAVLSAATTGSLLAFLYYNITPAKIFMGDTGSLLLGLTVSILTIKFIELNNTSPDYIGEHPWFIDSAPAVAIGILIIPLFDTLRAFTIRVLQGRSPFSPDKNHIHHSLLALGLSHLQATAILGLANILFIILAYFLQTLGTLLSALVTVGTATFLAFLLSQLVRQKNRKDNVA